MANDRSVRLLSALGGASTSRVLNLFRIAIDNANNPEHAEKPLFLSPTINRAILLKHRTRADEGYLFSSARAVATKIIIPFDPVDLRAGGRSLFVEQRGYTEALRDAGNYNSETFERDMTVLRLLNAVPSLDPFLVREHLRNNGIEVAPCYFAISEGDQQRMTQSIAANRRPETTKVMCSVTSQRVACRIRTAPSSVRPWLCAAARWQIATMLPISFILRPEKSRVPIQLGRSSAFSVLILETKFS